MLSLLQLKLIAGGALALALLIGGLHLKHSWQEEAYKNGQADAQVASVSLLNEQAKRAQEQLAQSQVLIDSLKGMVAASQARENQLINVIQDIQKQRSVAQDAVAKLPDSAIKTDLEVKAGGPLEDPRILRNIDEAFTDYPLVKQELATTNKQLSEVKSQVAAQGKQIEETGRQVQVLADYSNTLLGNYKQALQLLNRPKRRAACLWLCKRPDKLTLPVAIEVPR